MRKLAYAVCLMVSSAVSAALLAMPALASCQGSAKTSPAVKAYQASMQQMMDGMHIRYSGQVDTDFVRGMIPHHEGAVRMAEIALQYGGSDDNIRSLAQWIIVSQQAEIGYMRRWLETRGDAQPQTTSSDAAATPAVQQFQADMQTMHHAMNIAYSGDALHDFACGMIPHHEGAIAMAFTQLSYGQRPELQALAQRIIRSQKSDIARMQRWLNSKGLSCHLASQKAHAHTH